MSISDACYEGASRSLGRALGYVVVWKGGGVLTLIDGGWEVGGS